MKIKNKYQNALEKYRRRMNFSQKTLALILGHRDSSLLSLYERGHRLPPLLTGLRIGIALRVPVEFLFPALYKELREQLREREERLGHRKRWGTVS